MGLRPLACRDCGFVVSVLCRQAEISATVLSLVLSSPTDCVASFAETSRMRAPRVGGLCDTNLCTMLAAWLGCTIASLYETYCWNRREDTVCSLFFSSRLPGQGVCVRLSGWLMMC